MSEGSDRVRGFLGDNACLIVEPSTTFSSVLQACFKEMEISYPQVLTAKRFEDARRLIDEKKPKILITEFDLDGFLGLALIEAQERHYASESRLAAIVTANNSNSAIAEAAEEQVDLFILKPFSLEAFRQKLVAGIQRKMSPSAYAKAIQEGKRKLEARELALAIDEFSRAKKLHRAPTLAYFYSGQAYRAQGQVALALAEYQAGRRLKPLHYKCLIGEFEALLEGEKYEQAYSLVPFISENYPIAATRMEQIFLAAVYSFNFKELPQYCEMYQKLEQRPPRLTALVATALLAAGRDALLGNDLDAAFKFFDMGATTDGRSMEYIDLVASEYIKIGAAEEARAFLAKAPRSELGSARFNQLSFIIDEMTLPKAQVVEKGRKLVAAGQGNPEIFAILVRLLAEQGRTTLAESIIGFAIAKHPELRHSLYQLLDSAQAKAPGRIVR
jgi:DNA-binding response OmpR family regulator